MRTRRPIASATTGRRGHVAALVLVAIVLVASACQPDSGGISPVRRASGAMIDISGAHSAGGIMGVDILLGPDEYNPCHVQVDTQNSAVVYNDRFYAACQDSNLGRSSYFRCSGTSARAPGSTRSRGSRASASPAASTRTPNSRCADRALTVPRRHRL
jgi:hypothetical protein